MKALVCVSDRWDPEGGGRERYLASLVQWVESRGGTVRLLCRSARQRPGSQMPESPELFAGSAFSAERRLARRLLELRQHDPGRPILALRPQTEATHYQLHSGLYREAYSAERELLPSIWRRRLFWPAMVFNRARSLRLAAERAILEASSSTRLMCFSQGLADRLRETHGVDGRRIQLSRLGVDHGRFRPAAGVDLRELPAPERELRLLHVGHNPLLKGLGSAIRTLGLLRREGVRARLMVVGRGFTKAHRRLAAAEGVAEQVDVAGALPQDALADRYRRSHVLVHPTHYDPFSLVVLEAMASGCVVVTTRACGASELMSSGREGYVVSAPDAVQELAAALTRLADTGLWTRVREAALELARAFPFDQHAADVMDWLGSTESRTSPWQAPSFISTSGRFHGRHRV